jgi:hypothetical protein
MSQNLPKFIIIPNGFEIPAGLKVRVDVHSPSSRTFHDFQHFQDMTQSRTIGEFDPREKVGILIV